MARYTIKGLWDTESERTFYGDKYIRFLADLPSSSGEKVNGVGLYLPASLMNPENVKNAESQEIELPPGTRIMRLVPFTITVGDPKGLPRDPFITYEDLDVEGISIRALPASGAA